MKIYARNPQPQGSPHLALRCPECRQRGTFESVSVVDVAHSQVGGATRFTGQRRCPNPECRFLVFVMHDGSRILESYPPELLDFDSKDIPQAISQALGEAITCHAHRCYTAAAIMVRKTLEELCNDRGATGANLRDRIKSLGSAIIIPPELLVALDDLRLLGNDAAHIESQIYKQVGKEEVEIAIEFTKEVLKAVYQFSGLLQRLQSLKK
jgi:hypothetical protein